MNNVSNNNVIILILSITIGMMIFKLVIDTNELYVLSSNHISNMILVCLCVYNSNVLLIISGVSLLLVGFNNSRNHSLLIVHFILMFVNYYICMSFSIVSLVLLMISIDVISLINIVVIKDSIGSGIWYYLLFQTVVTIFMYYLLVFDLTFLLGIMYFVKLGSNVGGYYLPSLYHYVISNNIILLIYIGINNIILMYNPLVLLSSYSIIDCSNSPSATPSAYNFSNLSMYVCMINLLIVLCIFSVWISNGYVFINNWLYVLCISSIVLSNVYNIFVYIEVSSYSLYYYLFYFTLTSILVWFTLILTLLISVSICICIMPSASFSSSLYIILYLVLLLIYVLVFCSYLYPFCTLLCPALLV
jgi:hypothetical protein